MKYWSLTQVSLVVGGTKGTTGDLWRQKPRLVVITKFGAQIPLTSSPHGVTSWPFDLIFQDFVKNFIF